VRRKLNRNTKLYHFLDRVLEEVVSCRRDEVISIAQLQEELHTITGRWVDTWKISEMLEEIIRADCPLLEFTIV
jgi:hypothetical protein